MSTHSSQLLTKELIIKEYKNNNIYNYAELSEFKLISLIIDNFADIKISQNFPNYLLLDNFDLMLEIFGDWNYAKITDNDINKIVEIIEKANSDNIDEYHLKNIMFAIHAYAPKDVFNKIANVIKTKPELLCIFDVSI